MCTKSITWYMKHTSGSPLKIEFSVVRNVYIYELDTRLTLIIEWIPGGSFFLFFRSSNIVSKKIRVDAKKKPKEREREKKLAGKNRRTETLVYKYLLLIAIYIQYILNGLLWLLYISVYRHFFLFSFIFFWWFVANEMSVPICLWQTATCYWIDWTSWTHWNACCLS